MSLFTKLANAIFSPVDAAGHPRSVLNGDAQVWGTELERLIMALVAGEGGDIDLPNLLIQFTITGGTADAIEATPNLPLPDAPGEALFSIQTVLDNTGNVTINGKALRTNSGNEISPAGLLAGGVYLFMDQGAEYRLVSDQASAAIVAAAEAARDAALAAVPNAFPVDRTAMKALDTNSITAAYLKEPGREGQFLWHSGDFGAAIALDTAEGIYIKADDVAASSGAWVRAYSGAVQATWFGVSGSASPGDNVAALQVASYMAAGGVLEMPAEPIPVNSGVLLKSNTTVCGAYGVSRMIMTPPLAGAGLIDNAFFTNENWLSAPSRDSNIVVESMVFDWTLDDAFAHVQVPVFARGVDRIKVLNCTFYEGHNAHAFVDCTNTESRGNTAFDCVNAPYDHWNSSEDIIVVENVAYAINRSMAQGIQITGDDTDISTGLPTGGGISKRIIVSDNIVYSTVTSGTFPGIIVNNLTEGVISEDVTITGNVVEGADYGIVLQGRTRRASISGNVIRASKIQSILLLQGSELPEDRPEIVSIDGNVITGDPLVHIDLVKADAVTISGNTIKSDLADNAGIQIREDASNVVVALNNINVNAGQKIMNFAANAHIFETELSEYAPAIGAGSGTLGTTSESQWHKRRDGDLMQFEGRLKVDDVGTATGYLYVGLPAPADLSSTQSAPVTVCNATTGAVCSGIIFGFDNGNLRIYSAAGGFPVASGDEISVSGRYRSE